MAGEAILAETSIGDNDSDFVGSWTSGSDTASVGKRGLKELELMNWLFAVQKNVFGEFMWCADADLLQMDEFA